MLVIGDDLADHMPRIGCHHRVCVPVVRERDQSHGQGPAATSRPGRVINLQDGTESAPHAGGEKIPRDDQVTGGIAHSRGREVDDSTEPTLEDQQISGQQV